MISINGPVVTKTFAHGMQSLNTRVMFFNRNIFLFFPSQVPMNGDSILSKAPLMPAGLGSYAFQVAGHTQNAKTPCGMLHCPQRKMIYKYMLEGVRGKKEMAFYESVNSKSAPEPLRLLRPFLPVYHGVVRSADGQSTYLALSDLLASFRLPNVCDVKLGTVSYRVDATVEKKAYEDSKYRWQRNTGFIFSGVQIYDTRTGKYTRLPKMLLRSFNPQQIQTVVLTTFLGEDPQRSRQLASLYVEKLSSLWHWFATCGSQCVTFCRSSVLLAHETDLNAVENLTTVVVALIDFTDWDLVPVTGRTRIQTVDEDVVDGFARGLTSLTQMFKRIMGDITA